MELPLLPRPGALMPQQMRRRPGHLSSANPHHTLHAYRGVYRHRNRLATPQVDQHLSWNYLGHVEDQRVLVVEVAVGFGVVLFGEHLVSVRPVEKAVGVCDRASRYEHRGLGVAAEICHFAAVEKSLE